MRKSPSGRPTGRESAAETERGVGGREEAGESTMSKGEGASSLAAAPAPAKGEDNDPTQESGKLSLFPHPPTRLKPAAAGLTRVPGRGEGEEVCPRTRQGMHKRMHETDERDAQVRHSSVLVAPTPRCDFSHR